MTTLTRPNIVFINTDQQRFDTLGCYGSPVAQTPHLDRLAAEGVRFTRCYTTNPVCMPARASYVTGQYPSHHGVWMNGVPLSQQVETLQGALKRGGYATGLIGKIHLDNVWLRTEPHPAYDFDVLHECEGDPYCKDEYFHWLDSQGLYDDYMAQFKAGGHRNGYVRRLPEAQHMNNWIADHTEDYFRARAADGQPFFLSVGFFDPHHPFDPIEPYASMFAPADMPMPPMRPGEEERMTPPARAMYDKIHDYCADPAPEAIRGTIAAYHATITHVDAMVGRVMAALRETGLEENTVVVFTSDHGEMLGDHGLLWKGAFFYEGAVHVPLIYRFPARCGVQGVAEGFASHVDLAPTVAALTGVPGPHLAQGQPLFDADLRPQTVRDAALVEWREKRFQTDDPFAVARCLVTDDWKYVHYHGQPYGELYDLKNDPGETDNRWGERPEVVCDLRERLLGFIIDNEPCPPRLDIF
jgi:arylsulfatase A-like enzyme